MFVSIIINCLFSICHFFIFLLYLSNYIKYSCFLCHYYFFYYFEISSYISFRLNMVQQLMKLVFYQNFLTNNFCLKLIIILFNLLYLFYYILKYLYFNFYYFFAYFAITNLEYYHHLLKIAFYKYFLNYLFSLLVHSSFNYYNHKKNFNS